MVVQKKTSVFEKSKPAASATAAASAAPAAAPAPEVDVKKLTVSYTRLFNDCAVLCIHFFQRFVDQGNLHTAHLPTN